MKYLTDQDREHSIRKLAYHRIIARCLRTEKGEELHKLARVAFDEMEKVHENAPFIHSWRNLLSRDRLEIAKTIVTRDNDIELMRETSPFMRVFDFDMGIKIKIVFIEGENRRRMWKLAKKVGKINYGKAPEPLQYEGMSPKI